MKEKELEEMLTIIKNLDKIMNKTYKERINQRGKVVEKIISLFDSQYDGMRTALESLTIYVDNNLETNNLNITILGEEETENYTGVGLFDFWCWNFYLSDQVAKLSKYYKKVKINDDENVDISTKTALFKYLKNKNKLK